MIRKKLYKVLYISYDGLTDPLGQSQILPYLKGLAKYGYQFTILSFEKKHRFNKEETNIKKLTSESAIQWVPLRFTSWPPLLSKFYDTIKMRQKAVALQKANHFDMVHCRSYIAADVGLYLKQRFGIKFFFDMRGFWADEKRDGGSWNTGSAFFRLVYQYYKKKEKQYLQQADYIISLTEAGKKELLTWNAIRQETPIKVIPCCADMDHFTLTDGGQKKRAKESLGIKDELVMSYLGSVGTWYMLREMLLLFKKIKSKYPASKFLIVTHTHRAIIDKEIIALQLDRNDFIIAEASRKEVPLLIKASDINISFIKPVYSKISSSPTKLGEVLSMGIPVISNSGVGDVKEIIERADVGVVLEEFSDKEYDKAIALIPFLLEKPAASIREAIKDIYSLEKGIQSYLASYRQMLP